MYVAVGPSKLRETKAAPPVPSNNLIRRFYDPPWDFESVGLYEDLAAIALLAAVDEAAAVSCILPECGGVSHVSQRRTLSLVKCLRRLVAPDIGGVRTLCAAALPPSGTPKWEDGWCRSV